VPMLISENPLADVELERFYDGKKIVEEYFQQDFYAVKQQLKEAYSTLDPDTDTRLIAGLHDNKPEGDLSEMLEQTLTRANYEKVTEKGLQKALRSSSLFQVRLVVDLKDFEEVLLYTRGLSIREEELREFFGLWKRKIRFRNFDRVVLYIRSKNDVDSESALGYCPPGSTMLKLFQNVPEADLEMLFPNIRVGMRFLDKVMIGVPAIVSGAVVVTTKMGATLILLGSLLGFWLGLSTEQPVEMDKAAMIAVLASLGALGGYVWKQISNFKNRKLKYTQALTENLYFKLLDNNAGVFHRVLDDAEESECKESIIAYYFLLAEGNAMTAAKLDSAIETWFDQRWQCQINFDVVDALEKLEKLNLVHRDGGDFSAVSSE
jgi:hypothetical protein